MFFTSAEKLGDQGVHPPFDISRPASVVYAASSRVDQVVGECDDCGRLWPANSKAIGGTAEHNR